MKHFKLKSIVSILSFLLLANVISAQEGIVRGTMKDNSGDALPGVSVLVKGKTTGTITDINGNYSILCSVGDFLVFNYIGMETTEKEVTREMIKNSIVNPEIKQNRIVQKPIAQIKTRAYSGRLNDNSTKLGKYTDMYSTPDNWRYKNNRLSTYFFNQDFQEIKDENIIIEFVESPKPLYYEIEFTSSTAAKDILNLPSLQSSFAQGRPYLVENSWFGADSNEVFAWGPKIENLVFDNSGYDFDENGRLVFKNQTYTKPANVYNPYDIFRTGILLKNSVKLNVKKNDNVFSFLYTNRNETGVLEANNLATNSFNFDYEYDSQSQKWKAGLKYFSGKSNFLNSNALWTKTMYSILLTPSTFDNTQGYFFSDGTQRSSSPIFKNNPYYLMNKNTNSFVNKDIIGHASYEKNFNDFDFGIALKYHKNSNNELTEISQNTIGFINSYSQDKRITNSFYNLNLNAEFNPRYGLNIGTAVLSNYEVLDYISSPIDSELFTENLTRKSINWMQDIIYRPEFIGYGMEISLKNTSYIISNKQKWFLPTAAIGYDFARLTYLYPFNYLNLSVGYTLSVAEFPLYVQDKSHTTLITRTSEINSFLEGNELFYNEDIELETRESFNLGLQAYSRNFGSFSFKLSGVYAQTISENSIFPVLVNDEFELQNIGSIINETYEASLKLTAYHYSKFRWDGNFIFSKSNPIVKDLYGNQNQIPIAGFQNLSKNLIEGQAVGVIVGSSYLYNEQGEMIIGTDGYPLQDENLQIIGNPNPDFYMAFENMFTLFKAFTFSFLVDCQKGGDIWNGTSNTLDYYGLSESSATDRTITDYIFEGVTESGQVNNTAVDFADPVNGLTGNRWYRYGPDGIAEDAIEDGTWFRFKELALTYQPIRNKKSFIRDLKLTVFASNLFIKSKYTGSSPISYFNNYIQGQGLDYFNQPDYREIGLRLFMKF